LAFEQRRKRTQKMERGGGVAGDAPGEERSTRLSLHLTNPRKTWNQKKERVQEMS